jgi:hypothetical protein
MLKKTSETLSYSQVFSNLVNFSVVLTQKPKAYKTSKKYCCNDSALFVPFHPNSYIGQKQL